MNSNINITDIKFEFKPKNRVIIDQNQYNNLREMITKKLGYNKVVKDFEKIKTYLNKNNEIILIGIIFVITKGGWNDQTVKYVTKIHINENNDINIKYLNIYNSIIVERFLQTTNCFIEF